MSAGHGHSVLGKPSSMHSSLCDLTSDGLSRMHRAGVGRARLTAAGDHRPWPWLLAPPDPHSTALCARHQLPPYSPSSLLLGWKTCILFLIVNFSV